MDFRGAFRDLNKKYSPDIVILTETRLNGQRVHSILTTLGFENLLHFLAFKIFCVLILSHNILLLNIIFKKKLVVILS